MEREEIKQLIREEVYKVLSDIKYYENVNEFDDVTEFEIRLLEQHNYDLNNIFQIKSKTRFAVEFEDDNGITYVIKGKEQIGFIELKLYWIDENGVPRMDTPKLSSPKIMSTYLSIIMNHFMTKHDAFLIRPNDQVRYRLFQIQANRYIDKTIWEIKKYQDGFTIIKK